ncbi:MAG: hypothetical protein KatS3mg105_2594 [Gemmatales bacterium]|nr:MAG: hypothetical protein KatS3mg105_2594 [Gemmatales bacterium]
MKILVSGATGLVGSVLVPLLESKGHGIVALTRGQAEPGKRIHWDPEHGTLDATSLEGFEAVVHLAGENIAAGRWNEERKARIRDSRIKGTKLLCDKLVELSEPPKVLVSASAIGYYGSRGSEVLTEESQRGTGFLADVCADWEQATQGASDKGIRVVNARIGVVLSAAGGALAKMLLPFKLGLGGVVGNGQQYMSWIAIDDLAAAILHLLHTENLSGPVNLVAPHPVTNYEFTKTLGRVLGRPTILPMPAFAARLAFGEMADELLLSSTRVEPKKLVGSGFLFRFPNLEGALRHLLGR